MSSRGLLAASSVYNVNVGVLGHVDSGKTSLVAALSTKLSTAALDKHPQSKERGITLDLGFSCVILPMPQHLQAQLPQTQLQFTLVDCPGHASLIRTIMGGAQIIDMIILVVDVTKGIQTQTAECLVVAEVATQDLVVVLNKVDLLPAEARPKLVAKAKKRLAQTLSATKFAGCHMVAVAAKPGGGGNISAAAAASAEGVDAIVQELVQHIPSQPRVTSGPFQFAIDHCFSIKGQGTVMTGTVLAGQVKVNDSIELPELKIAKKVKSIQMFKQPAPQCCKGDRAGICVTQLDPKLIERGLACTPGSIPTFSSAIIAVEKIRFYVGSIPSRSKFHITVGHSTVMGETQFFGVPDGQGQPPAAALPALIKRVGQLATKENPVSFDLKQDYMQQDELHGLEGRPVNPFTASLPGQHSAQAPADGRHYGPQWGLAHFSQPVTAPQDALIIGSRFDSDADGSACRLAFYGRIAMLLDDSNPVALQQLHLFRLKQKQGTIERVAADGHSAVCKGMFKKETDISLFSGMKVVTANGDAGVIIGSFGKSGKFKVEFSNGLSTVQDGGARIMLTFKKYMHGNKHLMVQ